MPSSRPQAECRTEWSAMADALVKRARDVARETPSDLLHRVPPGGGWSAAQVFEHLVIANERYLGMLRGIAAAGEWRRAPAPAAWKPSVAGHWLVRSFRSRRRLPAPRLFQPSRPRADVIDAFAAGMAELVRLLDRLAAADWRRIRLRSPVSALIRLNLGDCFAIVVHHAARHLRQIDRTLTAAGSADAGGARRAVGPTHGAPGR